jgi:hypothetical protein
MKAIVLAVSAAAIALAAIAAQAQVPPQLAIDRLDARLAAAGYQRAGDVELDDGVYEIDVRDASGRRLEVHLDAVSGEILSPLQPGQVALGVDEVRARLAAAGHADIRELEREDGYWQAEVRDATGVEIELRVHPLTGQIGVDHD